MSTALRGWAARKAAVEAEARAEETARIEAERASARAEIEARPDAELLAEAGLPDPDEVDSADMVQAFLRSDLPQRLKTRALRKLWRLNPVLANVDGLVDYGEDFTDAAMAVDKIQTLYTVGKGMLEQFRDLEDEAPVALAETEADGETDDLADAEPEADPDTTPALDADADTDAETTDPLPLAAAQVAEPDPIPAASRRMRFRFDT